MNVSTLLVRFLVSIFCGALAVVLLFQNGATDAECVMGLIVIFLLTSLRMEVSELHYDFKKWRDKNETN
jgi:hypothetical protein